MATPRFHRLESDAGVSVVLCNVGASIARLRAPDRSGRLDDLVLGFDDPTRYRGDHPYLGATVGRVANRISGACYEIDGRRYELDANDGRNQLHGGLPGLGYACFDSEPWEGAVGQGVRFVHISPDGEAGHPGNVRNQVDVTLEPSGALRIDFEATTDRPTFYAPSHHAYWNLADGGRSEIVDHRLGIAASRVLPVDHEGIPSGPFRPVDGTPFDFRPPDAQALAEVDPSRLRRLGEAIDAADPARGGYDHDFALDGVEATAGADGPLRPAAVLFEPRSGRRLDVETTFPGLQLYSGNGLDGSCVGRGGLAYARRTGLCLEAQLHVDAPNRPWRESALLRPGQVFRATTVYRPGFEA